MTRHNPGMETAATHRPRRKPSWLPWLAGAVLVAGAVVLAVVLIGNTGKKLNLYAPPTGGPAKVYAKPKTVSLSKEARLTAGRFILTAVARKNLAEAWTLTAPTLRAGFTRKQWLTGAIPVVPFPSAAIDFAPIKVEYSYADRAMLLIALLSKDKNIKSQDFYIGLRKFGSGAGAHWLVDYWAPFSPPALPLDTSN